MKMTSRSLPPTRESSPSPSPSPGPHGRRLSLPGTTHTHTHTHTPTHTPYTTVDEILGSWHDSHDKLAEKLKEKYGEAPMLKLVETAAEAAEVQPAPVSSVGASALTRKGTSTATGTDASTSVSAQQRSEWSHL